MKGGNLGPCVPRHSGRAARPAVLKWPTPLRWHHQQAQAAQWMTGARWHAACLGRVASFPAASTGPVRVRRKKPAAVVCLDGFNVRSCVQ